MSNFMSVLSKHLNKSLRIIFCIFVLENFFWCGPFFKCLLNFATILLLFLMFWVFWPWGMWDLNSLTRDWTHIPCTGKWSVNRWTNQGSPYFVSFKFHLCNNSLLLSFPRWLVNDALGGKRLVSFHTEFEKCRCIKCSNIAWLQWSGSLWWLVNGDFKYSFGSHLGRNPHREKIMLANNRQSAKAVISAM